MNPVRKAFEDFKYDIPHIGTLYAKARESRSLPQTYVADRCNKAESSVSRLEKYGRGSRSNFKCFVQALQSGSVQPPLEPKDAKILEDLYDYSQKNNVIDKQCHFSAISFREIKSQHCPPGLSKLLEKLAQEPHPAMIFDALQFIHAVNGAALRLYQIDPDDEFLHRWEGWHTMASKFYKGSPIRRAHPDTDAFFPATVYSFFTTTHPFLFTFQMRALIRRLHTLSVQNQYKFTPWWLNATSFTTPFNLEYMSRTIQSFQGRLIETILNDQTKQVEIPLGGTLPFTLGRWEPKSRREREIFNQLAKFQGDIYFATDYDTERNFHVNNWPDVEAEVEQWLNQGAC